MKLLMLLSLLAHPCLGQRGFPSQFQAVMNISGLQSWQTSTQGVQQLLYDSINSKVRFDIQGWRSEQNETYMLQNQPKGAEADSVSEDSLLIDRLKYQVRFVAGFARFNHV